MNTDLNQPEFTIYDDGYMPLVTPLTEAAVNWVEANVGERSYLGQSFGGDRSEIIDMTVGLLKYGFIVHVNGQEVFVHKGEVCIKQ